MRINARLDEEQTGKLDYLRKKTGMRTSDLIREAIDLYYRKTRNPADGAAEVLSDTGFIGCGEAEPDLSANYKQILASSLEDKHGDR